MTASIRNQFVGLLLSGRSMTPKEITDEIGCHHNITQKYMTLMFEEGLVTRRKHGQTYLYTTAGLMRLEPQTLGGSAIRTRTPLEKAWTGRGDSIFGSL